MDGAREINFKSRLFYLSAGKTAHKLFRCMYRAKIRI